MSDRLLADRDSALEINQVGSLLVGPGKMATQVEVGVADWTWVFNWRNNGEKLSSATNRAMDSYSAHFGASNDRAVAILWNGILDADEEPVGGKAIITIWQKSQDPGKDPTRAILQSVRQQFESEAPANRQG